MDLSSPTSSEGHEERFHKTTRRKCKHSGADVLEKLKWVIFPENKWIKLWDMVVLVALFLLSFILPYQIGVSGAFNLLVNIPWLVFNVLLNAIFFVDTFLYFFRAYRKKNGQLVLNFYKIRRHYLRTFFVPNLLSVLPFTLAYYIVGTAILESPEDASDSSKTFFTFIKFAEILKLVRLARVGPIMNSSDFVTTFRLKRNSQVLELLKYVFLVVVVSHWFACTWAFVAYVEARSLGQGLLDKPNWIGFWYDGNNVDGGLNPIGYDQHTDRYALSLFWAIQTITSIGYGNIVPVTVAEWYVSCVLQLLAGVMWAYVIGGLVGVTAGMSTRAEAYRTRADQANDLINQFVDPPDSSDIVRGVENSEAVATHIRKYIHNQYKRSTATKCISHLAETFPAFDSLSPDLQEKSSFLVMNPYTSAVPYLSSKYLSSEELCLIAVECVLIEFSAGDTFRLEKGPAGLGRGIIILRQGVALAGRGKTASQGHKFNLMTVGMAFGSGKVLVEDDHPGARGMMQFLTFAKVLFIPRDTVLAALSMNQKAWKGCARWAYLRTLFLYHQEKEFSDQLEKECTKGDDSNEAGVKVPAPDDYSGDKADRIAIAKEIADNMKPSQTGP